MFSIFKKKDNLTLDWIEVDIHSHILPGIDDGSSDITSSINYIKRLNSLGIKKFVFTPHIFKELYPNNRESISSALDKIKQVSEFQDLSIEISASAEYMIDSDFDEYLSQGGLMTLPGNYLLIEMSYIAENAKIDYYVFNLNVKGYKPILAHPERYSFYHGNFDRYRKLKELGCLFQLNLLSVAGYYGKEVKQAALSLIEEGLIDLIGTDLHHSKHLNAINEFVASGKAWRLLGNYPFKNKELFSSSADKITIEG